MTVAASPYDRAMSDTTDPKHLGDPSDTAESSTTGTTRVKRGMAEMLKGGVIMDVEIGRAHV